MSIAFKLMNAARDFKGVNHFVLKLEGFAIETLSFLIN